MRAMTGRSRRAAIVVVTGAQRRLEDLTLRLEAARTTTDGAADLIRRTIDELRTTIAEVRGLAQGLHPTILAEAGLHAAVASLAERASIPVTVDIPSTRFSATLPVG